MTEQVNIINLSLYGRSNVIDNIISSYDDAYFALHDDRTIRHDEIILPVAPAVSKIRVYGELKFRVVLVFPTLNWHIKSMHNITFLETYRKFFLQEVSWDKAVAYLRPRVGHFSYYVHSLDFFDQRGQLLT